MFRQFIDKKVLHSRLGNILQQFTAICMGGSSILYCVCAYMINYQYQMVNWFNQMDKALCIMVLAIYFLKTYSSPKWIVEILTVESLQILCIILPVLASPLDMMSMEFSFYMLISFSRFIRVNYFASVMTKFHEIGDSDVNRKINQAVSLVVMLMYVSAGIFIEMENSENLDHIGKVDPNCFV